MFKVSVLIIRCVMPGSDNPHDIDNASRRRVIKAAGAGVMFTGLAGCTESDGGDGGGGDGGNGAGTGQGSVRISHWNSETQAPRREVVNGILTGWESESGNDVKITYMQETEMKTNLQTARTTGDFPTSIWATKEIMNQAAANDLNSDAGDVIRAIGEDKFYSRMLELSKDREGNYAGIPMTTSAFNMYYNEDAFEEEGLEPPHTWDAILEAAETFHDPSNDMHGIVMMNTADKDGSRSLSQFALANEAYVLNEDEDVVFDESPMVETLEFLSELHQNSPDFHPTWEDSEKMYANGQTNMFWMSAYIPVHPYVPMEMADRTRFGHYIENKRKVSYTPPKMMTLLGENANQSSDQVSTSKDLIEYWLTGDPYEETVQIVPGALMPVLKGYEDVVLENELFSDDQWGQDIAKDQLEAVKYAGEMGVVNGTPVPAIGNIQAENLIGEAHFRIGDGEDPQTVAEEQAEKMRNALD